MQKTILVTGGTGYIGSWVTQLLLEKGYLVRLTVRDKEKVEKYEFLQKIANETNGTLELWEADLLKKGSFDAPANGADAIMHIASPFTLRFKDAQKELIEPALEGTKNVIEAANQSKTVKKVVLTSSVAAVLGDNIDMQEQELKEFTEEQFNTTSSLQHQPYSYSKVLAEKEAWKMYELQKEWQLVVINPSFVMGPSLSNHSDSESVKFMKDMISGKFAMGAPDLYFGFVDVRDVAQAHILALENDNAKGRHILAERTGSIFELVKIVKEKFGKKYKLPKSKSPKWMFYLIGWMFGLKRKFIKRNVGYPIKLNNSKSKDELGLTYTPLSKTVEEMITKLEASNVK